MNFRTEIKEISCGFTISHVDKLVLVGSCFSNNIGEKLEKGKFETLINPFGILYNPVSIKNAFKLCFSAEETNQEELIFNNERFHSLKHHSDFSNVAAAAVVTSINERAKETKIFLKNAKVLFVTLGTAWVYRYNLTEEIVANCHKLPNHNFTKELLSVAAIKEALEELVYLVRKENSTIKIVFTISPVRHLKDGMIENNKSKSILNVAVHELLEEIENCHYFPSYEILMDDLRDYRFYKDDLLHPSEFAINYVWSNFRSCFFESDTINLIGEIEKIKRGIEHRSFNASSKEYKNFINRLITNIRALEKKHVTLNFSAELDLLNKSLL